MSTYWLPLISKLGANLPVVLVGNKIDTRGDDVENTSLEEDMLPIMDKFKQVETCLECSAKSLINISEVFFFAQKSVLHPTAPLYDSREHVLKPLCAEALERIFILCDLDKDNLLDNDELNQFQLKCFKTPLQNQELDGIKEIIKENCPGGIRNNSLTCDGFLALHQLFIQRGRSETTWAVLRKFGYGDDVRLDQNFLQPPISVKEGSVVELSPKGFQFFTELFSKYDSDKDGALTATELDELFRTSPGIPWKKFGYPSTSITNNAGNLTLQGFLAQWWYLYFTLA